MKGHAIERVEEIDYLGTFLHIVENGIDKERIPRKKKTRH
jgi:hypothetical protein